MTGVRRAAAVATAVVCGVAMFSGCRPNGDTPPLAITAIDSAPAFAAARTGPRRPTSESRSTTSAVVGARLIDYLLLALGSDTGARSVGLEVAAALRSMDGGGGVAARFDSLSAGGPARPPSPEIVDAIEGVVEPRPFRAAGWAEFARVFAAERYELGLRWTQLRGALDRMSTDRGLSAESRALADKLLTAIAGGPRTWPAIESASRDLLAALAQ